MTEENATRTLGRAVPARTAARERHSGASAGAGGTEGGRVLVQALLAPVKAVGAVYWFAWRRRQSAPARDAFLYRWQRRPQPCGGPFCDGCDECRPGPEQP